jgi:hypothetical protein
MDKQMTLDEFMAAQPRMRLVDWSTSNDAALAVNPSAGRLLAMRTMNQHPAGLTDFELAEKTGRQQTSIGKRRGECARAGLVDVVMNADGKLLKRPSPSGADALVWRITEQGRLWLQACESNNR